MPSSPHAKSRSTRWFWTILKSVLLVLALLVVVGVIYERLGERADRQRLPQIGRSVDIGGRSLNIYCSGEGSPTVILDTGGAAPGYSNSVLQLRVSEFSRACWFDRAGLGWSDPSAIPQTSAAIADDLHKLLQTSGIPPPYVLVGASFSGFNVRVFAGKYPSEVAGVVLADSVHEDQQQYEPRSALSPLNRLPVAVRNVLCRGLPIAAEIGLVRLIHRWSGPQQDNPEGFTAEQAATLRGLENQPKSIVAQGACNGWQISAMQARASGKLGDIPLIVLTGGKPFVTGDPREDKELEEFHEIWVRQLQPQLANLSTNGRQVILENSGHIIALNPEVAAIGEVVAEIRRNDGR